MVYLFISILVLYSGSEAEYEVHLHRVFNHSCEETMFVKYKNSEFGKDSVEYLGHIV